MIKVRIPTPLRPMTGGKNEVEIAGNTIAEIIENLGDPPTLGLKNDYMMKMVRSDDSSTFM